MEFFKNILFKLILVKHRVKTNLNPRIRRDPVYFQKPRIPNTANIRRDFLYYGAFKQQLQKVKKLVSVNFQNQN